MFLYYLGFLQTHLLTGDASLMVVSGERMFFKSQTFTVRSSLPETTLSPLANVAEVTGLKENTVNKHKCRFIA